MYLTIHGPLDNAREIYSLSSFLGNIPYARR